MKFSLSILLFFVSFMSHSADFVAGKDYELINDNHAESTSNVPMVTEFFSYGCPWCYRLEPALNRWVSQKSNQIEFQKVPVVFHSDWEYYAKGYYIAQALTIDSKMNPLFFKTIIDDKQPLASPQAMIDFFTQNGADKATITSAFSHSPSIELKIKESQTLVGRYHVTSVPTIVINGQFKTDLQRAKTEARLFAILDFLLTQSKTKSIT